MRFISKYGAATVEAIKPQERLGPNGRLEWENGERGVVAAFRPDGLREHEYELALKEFKFNGVLMQEDGITPYPPRYRIGVYDTDVEQRTYGWSPERKKRVEEALLGMCTNVEHKQAPAGGVYDENGNWVAMTMDVGEKYIILATEPKLDPPWPNYDELRGGGRGITTAEAIVRKVREDGYDPAAVIAYERSAKNREDVIAALETITEDAEEPIEVAV